MKKTLVLFSGMLAAAASFSAAAKTPEWFILKHPEVKIMERMQAQEAAGKSVNQQKVAMHEATASSSEWDKTPEWFVRKHPEVKIMERMQAQAAAKARRQQIAMHNADLHHAIDQTTGNDSHNS